MNPEFQNAEKQRALVKKVNKTCETHVSLGGIVIDFQLNQEIIFG